MKIGEPRHFRWLEGIVTMVFILNVMDGILTLVWLFTEQATEANPLMDNLIKIHPVLFISVKMALVFLGTALLWRLRQKATAVIAIFVAFICYYAILIYHLGAMNVDIILEWMGLH
jgi:hypothetical protein